MHVIRRVVLFLNFLLFLPPDNQFTQKSVAQLSHIRLGLPSRFIFYFSMQITRKCASIGRRGKFENSIVFGLVNNFRGVLDSRRSIWCVGVLFKPLGFVSGPFFFWTTCLPASIRSTWPIITAGKRKKTPELWILHLSTPNQSQSLFLFLLLVYA